MKFFVALVAFSAAIVLATAAPNPDPNPNLVSILSPQYSWPAGPVVYGGGGSHIAGYATGNGGLAPGLNDQLLSLNVPGLLGGRLLNTGAILGYNNPGYPVVWH
ncbi:uncharacterized protein LOC129948175 [Eupeodes corollae]|uniref:uncharacterized protein LOC129948175 n=1 Tax=Eupeodes corollae TaxID=290404 RepID=UPI002491AA7D|nr:uncharacterized protein LOC129948175 [Eupeodes corollae]